MRLFPVYYFPPIAWFAALAAGPDAVLEQWSHYRKQQYTNRCLILGANKVQVLSIPVQRDGEYVPLHQKRISYDQQWQKDHWRGIESAYRSSPYFEYYEHDLEECFEHQPQSLLEWNLKLTDLALKWLKLEVHYTLSDKYRGPDPDIMDLRDAFDSHEKVPQWLQPEPYDQVFGTDFSPGLSILDLVFNLGPESLGYLKRNFIQERFLQKERHA
jgi:WbqC-like protein family